MVTRKTLTAPTLTPVEVEKAYREMISEVEAEEKIINPALESLYAELDINEEYENARIFVAKLDYDGQGNEARVWDGDPEQYDLRAIARKFGSGQYRVKIYSRIPSGQRVQRGNKILGYLLDPVDEAKLSQQPAVSASNSLTADDIRRIVLETMQVSRPAPEPVNPYAQMKEMAEIMRMMQPQVAPAQNVDQFGMLEKAITLVKSFQGDIEPIDRGVNASTSDVLLGMLKTFGGPIANALQQGAQNQAAYVGLPPSQQVPQLQQNPLPPQPQPQEDDVNLKLKMGLSFLISACESGAAPETYAEVAIDHVPEAELNILLAMPDPIASLSQFDNRVEKHKEWFLAVFAEIRELMKDEPEEEKK